MVLNITVEYDVSRINSYLLSKKYCMELLLNMTLNNLLKITQHSYWNIVTWT